jgi:hypothetical protein
MVTAGRPGTGATYLPATVYPFVLVFHSWFRWAVVAAGLVLFGLSLRAWVRGVAWSEPLDRARVVFLRVLDQHLRPLSSGAHDPGSMYRNRAAIMCRSLQ